MTDDTASALVGGIVGILVSTLAWFIVLVVADFRAAAEIKSGIFYQEVKLEKISAYKVYTEHGIRYFIKLEKGEADGEVVEVLLSKPLVAIQPYELVARELEEEEVTPLIEPKYYIEQDKVIREWLGRKTEGELKGEKPKDHEELGPVYSENE